MIPEPQFSELYNKLKQYAVGYLCSLEPSKSEEFKQLPVKFNEELEMKEFKETIHELFAGCFDPESAMFKNQFKVVVSKMTGYLKFLYEQELSAQELKKIQIKDILYTISVPRSGSTFTHTLLSADPRASTIKMYEHLSPGNKVFSEEARMKYVEPIIDSITKAEEKEDRKFNTVHALDNYRKPEEEMFFSELLGLSLVFGLAVPRYEQYRESMLTRDWTFLMDNLMDEIKMHLIEFPLKEGQFLCLKCATWFWTPGIFFKYFGSDEMNTRFVWIHRDPVDNLKSAIMLYYSLRGRYKDDIGLDDVQWINDEVIRTNLIMQKNALSVRDKWIAENPERAKRICDIGFNEITKNPIDTVKKIYKYFGIEYTEEYDKELRDTIANKNDQKEHGRMKHQEHMYVFDEKEVREKFKFYTDRFADYIPSK